MFLEQKETILLLLQKQKEERNYSQSYLIAHGEFLDTADAFTDFCCERAEGKEQYSAMIEEIIKRDNAAKIFVEVYGFEEKEGESDVFIYADTLIIFTVLPEEQIQEVVDMLGDIFPNDFGEIKDDLSRYSIIDAEGKIISLVCTLKEEQRVLYFWWD